MSQSTDLTLSPGISGTTQRTELNDILAAIGSCHSGASRPSYLPTNGLWAKVVSGSVVELYFWDGTDDILVGTFNTASNTFSPAGQLGSFGSAVVAKTAGFTTVAGDYGKVFACDATSGSFTAAIAPTSGLGSSWYALYMKTDSTANTITIDPDSSNTINGATTITLTNQYDSVIVIKASSSSFNALSCPNLAGLARLATVFDYINSLTAVTVPEVVDTVAIYDDSAGVARKMTLENMLKVTGFLTEDTNPDGLADFILAYDFSASTVKKVKPVNLYKTINSLSTLAPDSANDFIPFFDVSGSVAGKATPNSLFGGVQKYGYAVRTSSGSFVTPAETTASSIFKLIITGGGGSGGKVVAGAAGATAILYITGLSASQSISVTIGAGGAAGATGGNAGGTSSFTVGALTVTATGGAGGTSGGGSGSSAIDGALGGTATNGTINLQGQGTSSSLAISGGGSYVLANNGASSFWGAGSAGRVNGASSANVTTPGAGSGASDGSTTGTGGPGIFVAEYWL